MQGAVHMTYWNGFVIFDPSSSHRLCAAWQPNYEIHPRARGYVVCAMPPTAQMQNRTPHLQPGSVGFIDRLPNASGVRCRAAKKSTCYKDNRTAATVAPPQQVTANSDCRLPRASRRGRPSCIAASRMCSSGVASLVGVIRSGVVRK